MGVEFYLKIPSSPSLLLQRRRATGDVRQPRCRWLAVRSGSAVIAEIAATGYVPISGTTGPSVSASARRGAGNAQRRRIVVSGDRRLGDRVHAASVYGGT
jgi:hypothetical protein